MGRAFATWLSPEASRADPFLPGRQLESDRISYYVSASDSLSVEFRNGPTEDSTRVTLPREMIHEWAACIKQNGMTRDTPVRHIRTAVVQTSRFGRQLHSLETHLKAAAFAMLEGGPADRRRRSSALVPVGADWTSSEKLLGYPDGLDAGHYIAEPTLSLVLDALGDPTWRTPHFLLLDEMNLSHVERYFADFLSAMESHDSIPLYEGTPRTAATWDGSPRDVPTRLELPPNLFVVGTVNVDETTYMFSPKVLDRANVIEFRMEEEQIRSFLASPSAPDTCSLAGRGAAYAWAFVNATLQSPTLPPQYQIWFEATMSSLFALLQNHHAEYGYRTAGEAYRFVCFYLSLGSERLEERDPFTDAMDYVILQKLLPKLHGSRARLAPLLRDLWRFCLYGPDSQTSDYADPSQDLVAKAYYQASAEKIARMWRLLANNGFASFAEA